MQLNFTARHFKAPEMLREFAEVEAEKLNKFYDGLLKCEVILVPEKPSNNIKTAEIIITANNHHKFTAKERTDDYKLAIEGAFTKVRGQLKKFKEKLKSNHAKVYKEVRVRKAY
jgi:putative sigma-54 modulation protein